MLSCFYLLLGFFIYCVRDLAVIFVCGHHWRKLIAMRAHTDTFGRYAWHNHANIRPAFVANAAALRRSSWLYLWLHANTE